MKTGPLISQPAWVIDRLSASGIFVLTFVVFWLSPIRQITDSNYSMLLSEDLIHHHSFALDRYSIPRLTPTWHDNTFKNGEMYQLELVGPHLYYYLPPGSSLLSLPYVAWLNVFGYSAANLDGTYNPEGEERIEAGLAALLMAGMAVIVFNTARLLLPATWSASIALAVAFGTQVWSTASRALWSDTWAVFLLSLILYMLLADELGKRRMRPMIVATLLAWTYFVRPTNSISVAALTLYVFLYRRDRFVPFVVTGLAWLVAFVAYSWYHFHQLLPNYFRPGRLSFGSFWTAFAGNLISPSRGLLIYVPVLLFLIYLVLTQRKVLAGSRLVMFLLPVIIVHLIVISGFTPWNGGFAYGPRYTTGLVPVFALLTVLSVHAFLLNERGFENKRLVLGCGAVLLCISIFINARGAVSYETWMWNVWPNNVDQVPKKIWDWRQPQFLAGLIAPPLPESERKLDGKLLFGPSEADRFAWYGWSWGEQTFRWSDGYRAAIVFDLDQQQNSVMKIRLGAFAGSGRPPAQRVAILLNNVRLQDLILKEEEAREIDLNIDAGILRGRNVLSFDLPDAKSPNSLGLSADRRRLAIRIEWLELLPAK